LHAKGHAGMALLITFGLFSILNLNSNECLMTGLMIVALVTLPDIDLRLEIAHRKYTHNILAAAFFGGLFAILYRPLGYHIGFLAGFSATLIHILGDLLTYMEFAPLWPFVRKKVSLKLFKSSSPIANNAFWAFGSMSFLLYLLFIYSDVGYTLLKMIP